MARATTKGQGALARAQGAGGSADAALVADDDVQTVSPGEVEAEVVEESAPVDDYLDDESLRLDRAIAARADVAVAEPLHRSAHHVTVPTWMMGNPVTRFIGESIIELMKTTWPSRNEAWSMTLVVIGLSAFVAVLLGVADIGLAHVLTWVVSLGAGA